MALSENGNGCIRVLVLPGLLNYFFEILFPFLYVCVLMIYLCVVIELDLVRVILHSDSNTGTNKRRNEWIIITRRIYYVVSKALLLSSFSFSDIFR